VAETLKKSFLFDVLRKQGTKSLKIGTKKYKRDTGQDCLNKN
jgi:hypothetical protein